MENENIENPWTPNLEEYLYFCCPECDMKDQSKEKFLKHALDEHPKAKEILLEANFNKVKVKQEILEDEISPKEEYFENLDDMVKCEINFDENPLNFDQQNVNDRETTIEKNYKCENCDKNFSLLDSLKYHQEIFCRRTPKNPAKQTIMKKKEIKNCEFCGKGSYQN